jgi:hypothetical protein
VFGTGGNRQVKCHTQGTVGGRRCEDGSAKRAEQLPAGRLTDRRIGTV